MTEEILDQITHLRKRVAECTDDYLRIGFLRITGAEAVAALSIIDAQAEALRQRDELLVQVRGELDQVTSLLGAKDEQLKVAKEGLHIIATVSSAGAVKYAVEHAAMRSQAKDTLAALAALETKQVEG